MSKEAEAHHWYVYIIECADGTYYTGVTPDVMKRLKQHTEGIGAKYTRGRGPVVLVYSEPHPDRSSAQKKEAAIKKLTREQKRELIISTK
jgi:putative endonuclease